MDTLPDELLLKIFEAVITQLWPSPPGRLIYIGNRLHRTRNLHRLSLVSRRFNRIVTPLLYGQIHAPFFLSDPFWKQIVETLHQNPTLAQLIKTISMTQRDPIFGNRPPDNVRFDVPLDLLTKTNCYEGISVADAMLDLERRSKRCDFVLGTFLILQAPLLEKLELLGYEYYASRNTPNRLPLAVEEIGRTICKDLDTGITPQCFQSLRSLRIDLAEWRYFPPEAVIPFLYLPQLKQLTLECWAIQIERRRKRRFRAFGSERKWPLHSSSVQELNLDSTDATANQMNDLLSACTALKSFECTASMFSDVKREQWYMQISNSLLDHAGSLETVIIGVTRYAEHPRPAPFKHTSRLSSLKTLQISYDLLIGNDPRRSITEYLPSSLEYLCLHFPHSGLFDIWDDMEANIVEISRSICNSYLEGSLPYLKGSELSLNSDYDARRTPDRSPYMFRPDVRDVVSAMEAHSVKFGVSIIAEYREELPPTVEDMRALRILFPGILSWCKGHRILRASTSTEPCVPGYRDAWTYRGPYGKAWKPWDFENDPEAVEE